MTGCFTIIRKHYDIQQSLKKQALAVGVQGWFMYIHSYVKTSSCPLLLKQLYNNVDVHGQMFDWCITFRIHSLFHFNFALILGQKEKRNNTQGTHHHYHKIQDCHICQKFNKLFILQFCPSCVQSFKISVYFSINQNSKSLNTLNK